MEMVGRVLLLGAGLSSPPLSRYLTENNIFTIVASRTVEKADQICSTAKKGYYQTIALDVEKEGGLKQLDELIPTVDAVISMLPYLLHPLVAKMAIKHKKHFLTTSYISPAMRELSDEAAAAGIVIIMECGVDPGTDHMSAMKLIHEIKKKGGEVVYFTSFCGGLPAPEANDNPLGYKFSWAPRGVLLAARNDAKYLSNGVVVSTPSTELWSNTTVSSFPELGFDLEGYPNRDSTIYVPIYELNPDKIKTLIRGTFRLKGWSELFAVFVKLGFLSLKVNNQLGGHSVRSLVSKLLHSTEADHETLFGDPTEETKTAEQVKEEVATVCGLSKDSPALQKMEWLGLFSDDKIPSGVNTVLDVLANQMKDRMAYAPGQRDMIVLRHTFHVEYENERKREVLTSTLIDYGLENGDTSMCRTVSYPVAIATKMVLQGKFKKAGLHIPTTPDLYVPILEELASLGIKYEEKLVSSTSY